MATIDPCDKYQSDAHSDERRAGIVGLGEVGSVLAGELAGAGWKVRCLDSRSRISHIEQRAAALGVEVMTDPALFASELDALFVTTAGNAVTLVACSLVPHMPQETTYIDCATKSLADRDYVQRLCAGAGLAFVDLAIVDTVTVADRLINVLVSGSGAERAAAALDGTRFVAEILDTSASKSAEVRLCRTIFTKGMSALLLETLAVAKKIGVPDLIRQNLARVLAREFDLLCEVNVGTLLTHAGRRASETDAAADQAYELLGGAPMSRTVAQIYGVIARELPKLESNGGEIGESGSELVISRALKADFFRQFKAN